MKKNVEDVVCAQADNRYDYKDGFTPEIDKYSRVDEIIVGEGKNN
jgi:hypothetical protein